MLLHKLFIIKKMSSTKNYFYTNYLIFKTLLKFKSTYNNNFRLFYFLNAAFYENVNFNYDVILPQTPYIMFNVSYFENIYNKVHYFINIRLMYIYAYKLTLNFNISLIDSSSLSLFYFCKNNTKAIDIFSNNTLPKEALPIILYFIEQSSLNWFPCFCLNKSAMLVITYDWLDCFILCIGFFFISFISLLKNYKDILRLLISLELLLLSVSLLFALSSSYSYDIKGYLIMMFLLTAATCESAVGLSLVVNLFRKLKTALWYFLIKLRR